MKEILLATHNRYKLEEISSLLSPLGFHTQSLADFPSIQKTNEDQTTLEGNALKKAREAFQTTGLLSLADDTGLEVFYLRLDPGVFSARYAGEHATFEENNKKLLWEMMAVPKWRRGAQFCTVIALVGKDIEQTFEGKVEGTLLEEPRGSQGFGYDPLFVPNGYSKTYAEMTLEEKNKLSHRAQALQKTIAVLKTI